MSLMQIFSFHKKFRYEVLHSAIKVYEEINRIVARGTPFNPIMAGGGHKVPAAN